MQRMAVLTDSTPYEIGDAHIGAVRFHLSTAALPV